MNSDRLRGRWKQCKGGLTAALGRLVADPGLEAAGRIEVLAGRLQEAYGIGRDAAHRELHARRQPMEEVADADDAVPRVGART